MSKIILTKLSLKAYQKLAVLALMLNFSTSAIASDPSGLPILFIWWLGCPMLILCNLVLILILFTQITPRKRMWGLIFTLIIFLANLPIICFEIYLFAPYDSYIVLKHIFDVKYLPVFALYISLILMQIYYSYRLWKVKGFKKFNPPRV